MRKKLLTNSRSLDRAMMESNASMIKLTKDTSDQELINELIYKNLGQIRDIVVDMILSFDKVDAIRYRYNEEYETFIECWDNFTSKNVSPQEAGVRLERVRVSNLILISTLEKVSTGHNEYEM